MWKCFKHCHDQPISQCLCWRIFRGLPNWFGAAKSYHRCAAVVSCLQCSHNSFLSFSRNCRVTLPNSSFIFRSTMKAFIYFSRRSQQDQRSSGAAERAATVLAAAAATLCKRQKTSPLLFKSSTKSVFHCCYRWAASYLLPAAVVAAAAALLSRKCWRRQRRGGSKTFTQSTRKKTMIYIGDQKK